MHVQETINFKLTFKPNYWNLPPHACVSIDDQVKFDNTITVENNVVEFSHTLLFNQPHKLMIKRSGKTDDQVRKNTDGTYDDQMLIISKIVIDGVNVQNIIYTDSYYEPNYPKIWAKQQELAGIVLEKKVIAETHLGHNGTWTLPFTSPFYLFLMDKMNV